MVAKILAALCFLSLTAVAGTASAEDMKMHHMHHMMHHMHHMMHHMHHMEKKM